MGHTNGQKAVLVQQCGYDAEESRLWKRIQKEQKILEEMVAARFENGRITNLGTDVGILKQSLITDRLVVDKMKLEEMRVRHKIKPGPADTH